MGAKRTDRQPDSRKRILEAGRSLFDQSPTATLAEVATAAGLSRSTVYRHFSGRRDLLDAIRRSPPTAEAPTASEEIIEPGRMGRDRAVPVEAIRVFDLVAPSVLPEQLVAEAERIAKVPVALYVVDIDGSHLLRLAGPDRLPERLEAPLAIGPELDSEGVAVLRARLADQPGLTVVPLWLRGRATGVLMVLGRPERSLSELARQAAAATTLADRYTDAFAAATRRKPPKAAAEIQQSLLPPRINRITGGEIAGNVLPSYEVAGDWFDAVENADGVWFTVADGLGGTTRAAASSAVALGALRASRRSGGTIRQALMLIHRTLHEMPGPRAEMTAVAAHWDPVSQQLHVANCGHIPPTVIRAGNEVEHLSGSKARGLGGRASPRPDEQTTTLGSGDRLIMVSDGVVKDNEGQAGLGVEGLVNAALASDAGTAADTVRKIHAAVLEQCGGELQDDATAVCLAVS